jgi:pimeloyl-ACP methyl ester carboxylesterase
MNGVMHFMSRRTFVSALGGIAVFGSTFGGTLGGIYLFGSTVAEGTSSAIRRLVSARHATAYLEEGPADGPLMIFVHGWPELSLVWRAQMVYFAALGWRCIAPDMRGYGGSSAPTATSAYAMRELVADMVELHDALGAAPAVWVGHDWGSPVIASLAAQHPQRCRGAALISVPYFPRGFALANLVPLVDRALYPADRYPDGQWDYFRFYQTHFDQAATDYEADIPATLASIFKAGTPAGIGKPSPTASVTRNGGRYGAAHNAPPTVLDPTMLAQADFDAWIAAFCKTGFRPADAWYLNDADNIAYAEGAPDGGRLRQPVLFLNGAWDGICDITGGRLGEPMRQACTDLTVVDLQGGHWLPLERKAEVNAVIDRWLIDNNLRIATMDTQLVSKTTTEIHHRMVRCKG